MALPPRARRTSHHDRHVAVVHGEASLVVACVVAATEAGERAEEGGVGVEAAPARGDVPVGERVELVVCETEEVRGELGCLGMDRGRRGTEEGEKAREEGEDGGTAGGEGCEVGVARSVTRDGAGERSDVPLSGCSSCSRIACSLSLIHI